MRALHVYSPTDHPLDRELLAGQLDHYGWIVLFTDPGDKLPFGSGTLSDDLILGVKSTGVMEKVITALKSGRYVDVEAMARSGQVNRCQLIVEYPFHAESVLGPLKDAEEPFGRQGVLWLRQARTLYAINIVEGGAASQQLEFQRAIALAITKAVGGKVFDCENGKFLG